MKGGSICRESVDGWMDKAVDVCVLLEQKSLQPWKVSVTLVQALGPYVSSAPRT